jgi:hypothetical protein
MGLNSGARRGMIGAKEKHRRKKIQHAAGNPDCNSRLMVGGQITAVHARTHFLGAVYTYVFAFDSPFDLHANRIPIRFSVRFPIRLQSTPISKIVDEFNLLASLRFGETHTAWATGRHRIG